MKILAYVDPGLGLLAWQAIIALCVGVVFYMRKTRDWAVRSFLRVLRVKESSESPAQAPAPEEAERES